MAFIFSRILASVFFLSISSAGVAAQRVPDVTVKANQSTQPSTVPYFGQVITKEDITHSGATQITDLLKNKAGLQGRDSTGNGANFEVSLRGFGGNAPANALVIVDGAGQNGYDLMPPHLGYLNIDEIERIEIIPGSLGTLLGEQAVGGAIEITTKKPSKRSFGIRTYQHGPDRANGLGLAYSDTLPHFGYRFGFNQDNSAGYRDRNKRRQQSGQVSLYFPMDAHQLRIGYQGANEKVELPGALTETQLLQNRRQAQNLSDFAQMYSHHIHGSYQAQISQHWGFELYAGARRSNLDEVLSRFPIAQKRTLYFAEPKLFGSWLFLPGEMTFTAGLLGEGFDYSIKGFGTTQASQKTVAPYVRMTLPVVPKLSLILGTRWTDQSCHLSDSFSPQAICQSRPLAVKEVGLDYRRNSALQLYVRRDENFRLPKVDEQTWLAAGTKLLKPQRGVSYETGARYTDKKRSYSIAGYHLALKNEIDFDPIAISQGGFPGANRNLEPTVRRGILLDTRYDVLETLAWTAHYAWTSAHFQKGCFAGKKIPFVSEHTWGLGIQYAITPVWQAQLEYERMSAREVIGDYENAYPRVPGFVLMHATLSYDARPWRVSFRVHNLTNTLYSEVAGLREQATGAKERFFYPAPKRAWTASIEQVWE